MATAAETVSKAGVGLLVWWKGRFKYIVVWGGLLYLVGELLLITAQRTGHPFPLLIFAETLLAISRSTFDGVKEVALLQGAHLGQTPILLAMLSVCGKVGGMIGATIADRVWAVALPNAPKSYLSGEAILSAERAHPFLKDHLALPLGSAARLNIMEIYDNMQLYTLVAGSVAMVCAVFCALTMENVNVLSPHSKPTAKVRGQWLTRWHQRHFRREPLQIEAQPDMRPLLDGLNRLFPGHVQRLDALWQRVSEVIEDDEGCPQTVADDLLGLSRAVAESVWSLDDALSSFQSTIETFWSTSRVPVVILNLTGPIRESQSLLPGDSRADGEVRCLRDQPLTAGFVHLHHPDDGACVSVVYRSDGTAFLGSVHRPNTSLSTGVRLKYESISQILDAGVQKAFKQVDITPPPSIGVQSEALSGSGSSSNVQFSLNHAPLPQQDEDQVLQHPSPYSSSVARLFPSQVCECRYLDSDCWVHVHLPAYGLCWTFDWNRRSRFFPRLRAGTASDDGTTDGLTPERKIRLRTALERCISHELYDYYSSLESERRQRMSEEERSRRQILRQSVRDTRG